MLRTRWPIRPVHRHLRERRKFAVALQYRYKSTPTEESMNPVNVQLLSPALHKQIFPIEPKAVSDLATRQEYAKEHLQLQNIWGKSTDKIPDVSLKLPLMTGADLEEHFLRIGIEQSGSYLQKAKYLAGMDLPKKPKIWSRASGWTRYDAASGKGVKVEHPMEDVLVFDVETAVAVGPQAMMATAVSNDAWYSWTSPYLFGESKDPNQLIPMGKTGRERIVVGHNVGYDRARILEEYNPTHSKLGFLDTMSLHIAVSGLCSQQRPAWMSEIKRRNAGKVTQPGGTTLGADAVVDGVLHSMDDVGSNSFFDVSALNSLKDVVKFHCNIDMDKSTRDILVDGELRDVKDNFDQLMQYCATDVEMTHNVYKSLWPKFHENCPHPVSFAGMLQMGNSILTVNERWEEYLANSVAKHKELEDMLDVKLQELAENARALVGKDEEWQKDPWLSQLDWLVNPRQRKLKGQPKWYKDAYDTKAGKLKISTRSRIAPLLLRLKWQDHPIHYLQEHGWCFKIPIARADEAGNTKMVSMDEDYFYYKIPHKDGEKANCGNPIAKNYLHYFEEGVLSSEYDAAREALELNAKSAYWISSRERILGQYVVWDTDVKNMGLSKRPHGKNGIILPQMVTMGTVTRRAVEKTWLTASNAKANRIGSELKSMVQAPEGYKIVGADVDSEELWISSIIGDAQFGFHGATALGWMTLQGSKSEGTDLHSKTAHILGISRDKAKVFNYARIYGAGAKYATSLLMQYNQDLDLEEAKQKAANLYLSTKGEKQRSVRNPFKRAFWHGGTESYMFNALEDIALCKEPRTPILGCAITDALKPKYAGTQFLTSRINWVVQSSAVDYLHMLLVSMSHLIERYDIDARFMLSVHDEVRYLSSEKDQHRTALALQIANLWTRALFSYKLGIHNLPQAVGFFSAVDVDHVLRKEPNMHCLTPSNPTKIAEGKSYSINETINQLRQLSDANTNDNLLGPEKATLAMTLPAKAIHDEMRSLQQLLPESRMCDLDFLKAQMLHDYKPQKNESKRGGRSTEVKYSKISKSANSDSQNLEVQVADDEDHSLFIKYDDGTMPRSSVRVIQAKLPTTNMRQPKDDPSSLYIPAGVLDALVMPDPAPSSSQQRSFKKSVPSPTKINWISV